MTILDFPLELLYWCTYFDGFYDIRKQILGCTFGNFLGFFQKRPFEVPIPCRFSGIFNF